ncbi:hypothetical protein [Fulvimarina sp. MAC3]|uniref:hypothetical protein n=1 Tax=Fulvimarina sp. MAC3 TaxID=3148887 RepID=UPI0031FBF4C8
MPAFLIIVGLLGYGLSFIVLTDAASAFHDILATGIFTNATLFLIGGLIVKEMRRSNTS